MNSIEKRSFLKKISDGICHLYDESPFALNERDTVHEFIKTQLLIVGEHRTVFSKGKFKYCVERMSDDAIFKILMCFDSIGITIDKVLNKSKINTQQLSDEHTFYIQMIQEGEVVTFQDFLLT